MHKVQPTGCVSNHVCMSAIPAWQPGEKLFPGSQVLATCVEFQPDRDPSRRECFQPPEQSQAEASSQQTNSATLKTSHVWKTTSFNKRPERVNQDKWYRRNSGLCRNIAYFLLLKIAHNDTNKKVCISHSLLVGVVAKLLFLLIFFLFCVMELAHNL